MWKLPGRGINYYYLVEKCKDILMSFVEATTSWTNCLGFSLGARDSHDKRFRRLCLQSNAHWTFFLCMCYSLPQGSQDTFLGNAIHEGIFRWVKIPFVQKKIIFWDSISSNNPNIERRNIIFSRSSCFDIKFLSFF